jgi:hypothetical protein
MGTVFCDAEGGTSVNFLPKQETINMACYTEMLKHFVKSTQEKTLSSF